jgi:C_GCAxxG_C_C family probable redox protein
MDNPGESKSVAKARQRARELFLGKRANCAEAVFIAVMEQLDPGLPSRVSALFTPLGGGVGIRGENCGAMLAGVMALGLVHGRRDPETGTLAAHRGSLWKTYKLFNQLPEMFARRFGSLQCWDLTRRFIYGTRRCRENCEDIVADTAGMAIDLLQQAENGMPFKFQKCLLEQAREATGLNFDELIEYKSLGRPFPVEAQKSGKTDSGPQEK